MSVFSSFYFYKLICSILKHISVRHIKYVYIDLQVLMQMQMRMHFREERRTPPFFFLEDVARPLAGDSDEAEI